MLWNAGFRLKGSNAKFKLNFKNVIDIDSKGEWI